MTTLTIPKAEYEILNKQARAFRGLISIFFESIVKDSVKNVVADFRKTNFYTDEFLSDLELGLKKSSYFKKR